MCYGEINRYHSLNHEKSIEEQLQKETNFNPEENQKVCEQFLLANSLSPGKKFSVIVNPINRVIYKR